MMILLMDGPPTPGIIAASDAYAGDNDTYIGEEDSYAGGGE